MTNVDKKKEEWKEHVLGLMGIYYLEKYDREDVRRPSTAYHDGFAYKPGSR